MASVAAVTLLSTHGLTKAFAGLTAVNAVDFDLPEGQIRALIGPNGAGKTTLVGLLCGRIEPTSGKVKFDGRDITHLPAHKRILSGMAYTFQITSIYAGLSLTENVALAARKRWNSPVEVDRQVSTALTRVGLQDRSGQDAGDLAYGHQRLLEIAMGLVQAPRLLIMDEPTQGLSDAEIESFKSLVRELATETTILLIEHNMNVVMALAEVVTVLNFGEILAEGPPEEIRANSAVQTAYLGVA